MMVDDRLVLIGSADWTPRGFSGDKNSEICLKITDRSTKSVLCGGIEVAVGSFPHQLRMERMRDHLGAMHHGLSVDVSDALFAAVAWHEIATSNSRNYEIIDGEMSLDKISTLAEYKLRMEEHRYRSIHDVALQNACAAIRGHVVLYPMNFLCNDHISSNVVAKALATSIDLKL